MEYAQYTDQIRTALLLLRSGKAQGSLEYLMMLSAVSIVIIIALAMIAQLKGAAVHMFFNGSNSTVSSKLASELKNLSSTG